MSKYLVTLLLALNIIHASAQRHEILDRRIATLQVMAGDNWLSLPVITLGQSTPINIAFDDLTHEYRRYCYKLEHCEVDWTTSEELFTSDYCDGFAEGNTIDNVEESLNTNQLYTHYSFRLPNDRCRMKMSGNYRVTVYDENDNNRKVLTACFMVVEPLMGVGLKMTTNTDIDINNRYQQIEMDLNYAGVNVTDPATQIKTVVMQNMRWDNAVVNAKPQYVMNDGLRWFHCRDLIFNGGNEYRKFEMLDVNHTTMGLEMMDWDGGSYHAYIWMDEPRPNYLYDEDANGAFYIRNSDNNEIDYTCEYLMIHFRLKSPRQSGDVYINGVWTNDQFLPEYKMIWNETAQIYEAQVWLKQGYYSYQYLLQRSDGTMVPVPSEGNFYQTKNSYQALVYYRPNGSRTDRLVAYQDYR